MTKRHPRSGAQRNAGLHLSVFSHADLQDIHLGTLEVLEPTGVFVEDPAALDVFADAGSQVDRERRVVRIPAHVVEKALRSAPAKVVLYGRDPALDIVLEDGRVGFSNFGEGTSVVDVETGRLRDSVKQDVYDAARVVDFLDEIDCFEIAVGASDMPPQTASIHNHEAAQLNTVKPVSGGPLDGYAVRASLDMLAAIAGSTDAARERPQMVFGTCPVSPLQLGRELCEIVLAAARAGFPSCVLSMAMAGGSSPVTLAGTLVMHNAEVLSALTLAQLAERGVPVLYGSSTTSSRVSSSRWSAASP